MIDPTKWKVNFVGIGSNFQFSKPFLVIVSSKFSHLDVVSVHLCTPYAVSCDTLTCLQDMIKAYK